MTQTKDKLRSLFLTVLMVVSVFGATVAFTGTAAAANESVTFSDQDSLNGESVLIDEVSASDNDDYLVIENSSQVLANKTLSTIGSSDEVVDLVPQISESQTLTASVVENDNGTVQASDTADISYVESDGTDTNPDSVDTYWQGQVVVFKGDFTAGQDYQIRGVEGSQDNREVGSLEQEVRALNDGQLIVRSSRIDPGLYIVDDDDFDPAPGDKLNADLATEPAHAFELEVQNLDAEFVNGDGDVIDDPSVTGGNTAELRLTSNRAGFDVDIGGTNITTTTASDVSDYETITINTGAVEDSVNRTVEVDVTDTTAESSDDITLTPSVDSLYVSSGASFTQSAYTEETGDYVEINIDFEEDVPDNEDQHLRTWVQIGGAGDRMMDLVQVTDTDNSGDATLTLNTFELGRSDEANASAGYSAGDDSINVTRPRNGTWGGSPDEPDFTPPPTEGISKPLGASSYDLTAMSQPTINLSQDETELVYPDFTDASTLVLGERSLEEDISLHVAPSDASLEEVSDIQDSATKIGTDEIPSNAIANEDKVALQINATGLSGYVDSVEDLMGPNGLHLFVNQKDEPASEDRFYWDLADHGTLIKDDSADTYYVVVDTGDLDGVGTRDGDEAPLTSYEVNMVITGGQYADYLEEGEFPDDVNFNKTINHDNGTLDFQYPNNPYLSQTGQDMASSSLQLQERKVLFDDYVQAVSELRLSAEEDVNVNGTTNVAPGTSFRIAFKNTSEAFNRNANVDVASDRSWSGEVDLADQAGIAFQAQALESGVSITGPSQATVDTVSGPVVPGRVIMQDDSAVTFSDQTAQDSGSMVTVDSAYLNKGGYVVIHNTDGDVVGVSDYLSAGNHSDVPVRLSAGQSVTNETSLTAMTHKDTDNDGSFDFVSSDGATDVPYVVDGAQVTDAATVSPDLDPASFQVSELTPSQTTVTSGDTIGTIQATVENTGGQEANQTVELVIGGNAVDSQDVTLGAGESQTVTFSNVDTSSLSEGTYTHGIASADDEATGALDVEAASTPTDEPPTATPTPDDPTATPDDPTATPTPDDPTATDEPTDTPTSSDGGPGFGIALAIVALLGAALIAVRRD